MQTTINKELLKFAVQTAITCPRCGQVLDMRHAVTVTLTAPTIDTRQFTMCCACWDRVRLELNDLAMGIKGELEVLDGRDLFPPTLREAQAMLKALGVQLRYDRELEEYSVNLRGGKEATRCYTNDLLDAIGTGRMMAAAAAKGGK